MLKNFGRIVTFVSVLLLGYNNGEVDIYTDNPNCYDGPTNEYMGTKSTTNQGYECRRWDKLESWEDYYTDDMFPDGSKCKAKNHCRDPGSYGMLWCYTEDSYQYWGECDIPSCNETSVYNITNDCYVITDKDLESGMSTKEICESRPGGKRVCEGSTHIPIGCEDCRECCQEKDCYTGCVTDYDGTWHRTESGLECQHWDSQWPHQHHYNESSMFPGDESVSAAQNYCRDPDESGTLWCFTTDYYETWGNCSIPEC